MNAAGLTQDATPVDAADLRQDATAVDVSQPETHYSVQCAEVRLLNSLLRPVEGDDETKDSHFLFKVEAYIHGDTAFSQLQVQVIAVDNKMNTAGKPLPAYELRFSLLGVFVAEGSISPEALSDFARLYTLSILWPYAREYTADQLRRAGHPFDDLPIINPQVLTETLIEADLVKVEILEENTATQAQSPTSE